MHLFVDENIPNVTVETLRELGHDVLDFRGTDDEVVDDLGLCPLVQRQGRLLIRTDKGFHRDPPRTTSGLERGAAAAAEGC